MSSSSAPAVSLNAFDNLTRGDRAPDWVSEGIRSAWPVLDGDFSVALIGVSENATFVASSHGIPQLVVRVHRPGYLSSIESAQSELVWVEALVRDIQLTTPSPARGRDGEFVQFLAAPGGANWTAVAFSHISGTVLENAQITEQHFAEIGTITAQMHGHARTWAKPQGFARFEWDIPDLVGATARWGAWQAAVSCDADRRLLEKAEEDAVGVVLAAGKSVETWGLIHSDLRPSNVIVDGDALAIIDFDDCGYGWYLYDFAAAMTFYEHRPETQLLAASWLNGYRQVAPLSRDDLELAGALSMVRRLTMLGWSATHRRDAIPADLADENLPGSIEVARRYLADPLWLVGDI